MVANRTPGSANLFSAVPPNPKSALSPWPFASAITLGLILGVLVWSSRSAPRAADGAAALESQAAALSRVVELQFGKAFAAVETLATLARQGGGGIANFQKVASELHTAFPELATLELQPGGVLTDIVPRAGTERFLRFNVLKDPAYGPGAAAAARSRSGTAVGPLRLYDGQSGFVFRVPLFKKSANSSEQFAGFVAVSMKLNKVLETAGLNEMAKQGFGFWMAVPGPGAKQTLVAGAVEPQGASIAHRSIPARNLDLRLAVWKKDGGAGGHGIWLDFFGVLVISSLAGLVTYGFLERNRLGRALETSVHQVASEKAAREEAQRSLRNAVDRAVGLEKELGSAAASARQSAQKLSATDVMLEERTRLLESVNGELLSVRSQAADLQTRLQHAEQVAERENKASQKAVEELRTLLSNSEQKTKDLEARLDSNQTADRKAAVLADMQRAQQQAAVNELKEKLKAQAALATQELDAAFVQVKQLHDENRQLKKNVEQIEQLRMKLIETNQLLESTTAQLREQELRINAIGSSTKPEDAVETAPEEHVTTIPAPEVPTETETGTSQSASHDDDAAPAAQPAGSQGQQQDSETPLPATVEPDTEATIGLDSAEVAVGPVQLKRAGKRKPSGKRSSVDQIELFGAEHSEQAETREDAEQERPDGWAVSEPDAEGQDGSASQKAGAQVRRSAASAEVDVPELRSAVNQIWPLLADKDPGAKDCLKGNRVVFRSAFPAGFFEEFERFVKSGDYIEALAQLTKMARRHGIHV